MEEAILALKNTVKDAERSISLHLEVINDLEAKIEELEDDLEATLARHNNAVEWKNDILRGLTALEEMNR